MREVFSLNRECRVLHGIESAQGLKNRDQASDIFIIINNIASLLRFLKKYIPQSNSILSNNNIKIGNDI